MKVTVLLPTYNSSNYIIETLTSICSQDEKEIELIVIDDASTDNTLELVDNYLINSQLSYKVIRKPYQKGVCDSLTIASKLAKGEYLAQIGHDDVWLSSHLSSLVELLEKNNKAVAAFSEVEYINENSKVIDGSVFRHIDAVGLESERLFSELLKGNFLCAPSSLIRKSKFNVDYWGYRNERLQDYLVWLFLSLKGEFVFSSDKTTKYRLHSNNLSSGDKMLAQSKYEFYSCYSFVFQSDEFVSFIGKYKSNGTQIREISEAINFISGYYPGIYLAIASAVERRIAKEPEYEAILLPLLENSVSNLGLYRKKFSIRKVRGSHCFYSSPQVFVVPVTKDAYYKSFVEFLSCSGFVIDGTHTALNERSPFYYLCREQELANYMEYDSFRNALSAKRVLITVPKLNKVVVTDEGVKIPEDFRLLSESDLYQLISHLEDNFVYLSPVLGGMGHMPFNSEPTLKEIKYLILLECTYQTLGH